jgi:hypothetical protein
LPISGLLSQVEPRFAQKIAAKLRIAGGGKQLEHIRAIVYRQVFASDYGLLWT